MDSLVLSRKSLQIEFIMELNELTHPPPQFAVEMTTIQGIVKRRAQSTFDKLLLGELAAVSKLGTGNLPNLAMI